MKTRFALVLSVALLGAAAVAPLERLTVEQRLVAAPPSTIVRIGTRTVTLGQLRAAHRAREANRENAALIGRSVSAKLRVLKPVALGTGRPAFTKPGVKLNGSLSQPLALSVAVVEPASQYASAPPDMKAFCASANASACVALPPQQQVQTDPTNSGNILDLDSLLGQSQCGAEGGYWGAMWGSNYCEFTYPAGLIVHFTPAANYKLSTTAVCDKTLWSYQVDVHGAISIQLLPQHYLNFTTGTNPSCVVRVTTG